MGRSKPASRQMPFCLFRNATRRTDWSPSCCRPETPRRAGKEILVTDIDGMLAEANERQRTGRLRDAEQLCSQVLQADPSSFKAHFLLGAVYHGLGKSHEAINSFRQAVQLGPDHAEAHNGLGVALLNSEKLDEAIASFQRATELKPDSAEISKNWRLALAIRENLMGAKLAEQRKFADATACFRWAVELKPDYAGAHYNLGSALVHVGELNAAIASYRRSLELEPAAPKPTTIWASRWASRRSSTKPPLVTGRP